MKTVVSLFVTTLLFILSQSVLSEPSSSDQNPPGIDSFEAMPPMPLEGEIVVLNWKTSYATDVYLSGVGSVNTSGSHHINNYNPNAADFLLTAVNNSGNFPPATKRLTLAGGVHRTSIKPQTVKRVPLKSQQVKQATVVPAHRQPGIPKLISPADNSTFTHYPRTLRLRWRPVNTAVSYNVEIDCMNCCARRKWCSDVGRKFKQVNDLKDTSYKFNFVGAQPGRWRVQAVDVNGKSGLYSQWSGFKFTR